MSDTTKLPVIVYSKPGCVQCNAVYRWLDSHGIRFRSIDVTESAQAFNHLKEKGVQQMPAVEIPFDREVEFPFFTGFDPGKLAQLL